MRIPVIIETDLFSDVDDVGALALAIDHDRRADIELLSVGINTPSRWGPLAAQALFDRYRLAVPIGRHRTIDDSVFDPDYARALAHRWGRNSVSPEATATQVHRQVLARAADNSATIVSIGFFGNLNDLVASEADDNSPLPGNELIAAKVRRTIVMGGWYPEGREFNLFTNVAETRAFLDDWPTPIDFIGYEAGADVITGAVLSAGPPDTPVGEAYRHYCGEGNGRPSWDLLAIHAAAQPDTPLLTWSDRGRIHLHSDGANTWHDDETGTHRHAVLALSADETARILDAQLSEISAMG